MKVLCAILMVFTISLGFMVVTDDAEGCAIHRKSTGSGSSDAQCARVSTSCYINTEKGGFADVPCDTRKMSMTGGGKNFGPCYHIGVRGWGNHCTCDRLTFSRGTTITVSGKKYRCNHWGGNWSN